ncbi:hypothetical protein PD280_06065 [Virgibacillus salarius]|uniref:hypothetical protein n=1 Tax=Virgibacillus salarius TaxID=447199 RepID=UPI00248FCB02|nr:hypothetical protein [Virgibacillus salarius]WBX81284.1 hypothetical protein PD280_06065 [Virgibacillus salarius]
MYLQFNVDNNGKIIDLNSTLSEYKHNDLLPYCIEVTKEEEQLIFNETDSFLLIDGVLTNNNVSFPLFSEHARKKITVALIDDRGYFIDTEFTYPEEVEDFNVLEIPRVIPSKLAKWNFDTEQWEYEDRPKSQDEMLRETTDLAVMDLAEILLGGQSS